MGGRAGVLCEKVGGTLLGKRITVWCGGLQVILERSGGTSGEWEYMWWRRAGVPLYGRIDEVV